MTKYIVNKILIGVVAVVMISCNTGNTDNVDNSNMEKDIIVNEWGYDRPFFVESLELCRDTIWGNFTGKGIDTLWLISEVDTILEIDGNDTMFNLNTGRYHIASNNKSIPQIKIDCDITPSYYCPNYSLVYEGDLDKNGTDEWGCMQTPGGSQWLGYEVFTLVNNRWYHLFDEPTLSIPSEWFESSITEIVEPADDSGYVVLRRGFHDSIYIECDTIVQVKFTMTDD